MRIAWMMVSAVVAILAAVLAQPARAQSAGDWPMYGHDLASTRFSPLTQINAGNVATLTQAWSYPMRPGGAGPSAGAFSQVTPIVVHGVMYLPAGNRVIALDPETGKEIWSYQRPKGLVSARGVAYWPGDGKSSPRLFFTSGHQMVALDARTGQRDPGFGENGEITMDVPFAEVPTIYKNVIIVGANVYGPGETNLHPQDEVSGAAGGISGDSRAYDARTGKKLWAFHSIAQPGEVGHNTWAGDSWKGRWGSNVWSMTVTVDEKRGIVYLPIGGPAANYYGGDRPGDNLFSNTLVAADANTGKLKWYFQTVHHELWDFDLPPEPVLLDITHDGKKVPAVVQTGKIGYVFVFDRMTGKPVFPIEERPVPKGDAPGEQYAPTQPFPVKPPPIARVSISRDDIVTADDTTPEHAEACQELWDKSNFYNEGPYTPWVVRSKPGDTKTTLIFPGATGGANWGGAASDPGMGYIFVNMQNAGSSGWLEKNPKYSPATAGNEVEYHRGSGAGSQYGSFSAPAKDASGKVLGSWPCQKPPWESLSAVNVNTGEIAWQVPLGITEELPEAKRHTGRAGAFAGPIATAGGLVFIGATSDNRFRAFDSKTGKELWSTKLGYTATAVPITYQGKNGKQYVAIMAASGGEGSDQALVVYALP
ncbi:MAG TPA: pyrroloquinoline quinone-dependent dehydrogenase [Candidatus Acidoferrales bacterium]|nr:pyrroloquinoline quinone-dependent dehydrogenase [Candidatus Acidoferrales bacterium]